MTQIVKKDEGIRIGCLHGTLVICRLRKHEGLGYITGEEQTTHVPFEIQIDPTQGKMYLMPFPFGIDQFAKLGKIKLSVKQFDYLVKVEREEIVAQFLALEAKVLEAETGLVIASNPIIADAGPGIV